MSLRLLCTFILFAALPAFAQPADENAGREHFFPLIADGDGFQSWLFVTNVSDAANQCALALRGPGLDTGIFETHDALTASGASATIDLTEAGASLTLASGGGQALAFGYLTLDCNEPVVTRMLLSLSAEGSTIAMTALESARTGNFFQLPVLPRLGRTGLLFANASDGEAACGVELADAGGANAGIGIVPVPAESTALQFLDELMPIPDEIDTGIARISCDREVAALGLPLNGPVFTALPAISLGGGNSGRSSHILPLVIDGDGFRSNLLVTNLGRRSNQCSINLYGDGLDAGRFEMPAGAGGNGSTTLDLAPQGGQGSLLSTGVNALAFGYAAVECDEPADVRNILSVSVQGNLAGMASVASSQTAGGFEIPVVPRTDRRLALVFSNDSRADTSCAVELIDYNGRDEGRRTVPVLAKSTTVRFLADLFENRIDAFPGGTATVLCDHTVNAISLPLGGAAFAALAPAITSAEGLVPDPAPEFGFVTSPFFEEYMIGEEIAPLQLPEATGGDAPLSYSLEPEVPGLIFDPVTRQLRGTPTVAEIYEMKYRVEDVDGDSDIHEFIIWVREPDSAPSFAEVTPPENQNYRLGEEIEPLQLPEAIGGNAPFFYSLDPFVPGLIFDSEARQLTGTPTETGVYQMSYSVFDIDFESDEVEFTITVTVPVSSESLLDASGCSDGAFVDDPDTNTGLAADCRALVGFANTLIETGLILEDNVIRQWGKEDQTKLNDWEGITVSRSGNRVIDVRLTFQDLKGPFPRELGQLSELEGLTLYANELYGPLPPEIGNLANLETLWLFSNHLSGSLPPELGQLDRLEILSLGGNEFSGTIPPELGQMSRLEDLSLWGNELSGAIPAELSEMPRLVELNLSLNELSGSIPPELGETRRLEVLGLNFNELTGSIPASLGRLRDLSRLDLSRNNLTGEIPPEIGDLDELESLSLQNNELTGPIPPEFGRLFRLESAYLYSNQLSGPIPPELEEMEDLRRLDVSYNRLTGTLPEQLANLEYLEFFDLQFNRLHGAVPWAFRERILSEELTLQTLGNLFSGFEEPPEHIRNPNYSADAAANGNVSYHSVVYFQGPKVLEWNQQGERTEHQTPILGRWAGLAVSIDHAVEEPPLVQTRVLDAQDTVLAESLVQAVNPETEEIESGQWRTEFVFYLPGELFQAGNQIVHVIDPDEELAETDETDNMTMAFSVYGEQPPKFRAAFVPITLAGQEESQRSAELDPDLLMRGTLAFLPIADDFEVRIDPPLRTSAEDIFDAIEELLVLWNLEAEPDEFFHGIVESSDDAFLGVGGVALLGTRVAVSTISIHNIIPHEFGHNFSLLHTPGCFADGTDENYPYPNGELGPERGWERNWLRFISGENEGYADLMSYCGDFVFMSGYNYRLASEYWLGPGAEMSTSIVRRASSGEGEGFGPAPDEAGRSSSSGAGQADSAPEETSSLALSGQVSAEGEWSLTQAQLSTRAPRPPAEDGAFTLVLFDAAGIQMYSEPLAVISLSDGDESFWAARTPLPLRTAREIVILDAQGNEVLRQTLADLE